MTIDKVVNLEKVERDSIVEKKVTCPFIGSAVAEGHLPVLNNATDPLASVEKVRQLGNTGGGDFGDLLAKFAIGNQAHMRGESGELDRPLPERLFSLDFPGSKGSHQGDSGILQSDPIVLNSGRLSMEHFNRLIAKEKDGWLKRSDVGHFIADNVSKDKDARAIGQNTIDLTITTAAGALDVIVSSGKEVLKYLFHYDDDDFSAQQLLTQKITNLVAEDDLVGSCGEFGLLFAFLANRPGAKQASKDAREPVLLVDDLREMFINKRLPDGWETWKKTWKDWAKNTTGLLISAELAYRGFT